MYIHIYIRYTYELIHTHIYIYTYICIHICTRAHQPCDISAIYKIMSILNMIAKPENMWAI